MGDVLAFIEQRDGTFRGVSREVISVAAEVAAGFGGEVHALAVGGPGLAAALGAVQSFGASRIRVAEDDSLIHYQAEAYAHTVAGVARSGSYAAVVFAATAEGRDLAPRVAALLDVPLASDVISVQVDGGKLTVTRPVYAGKLVARIELASEPALVSIRPNVFAPRVREGQADVETFAPDLPEPRSRVIDFRAAEGGALDVSEATVVVSGGRGMVPVSMTERSRS
jgi:electron transfer flavoprotein alpha subunit